MKHKTFQIITIFLSIIILGGCKTAKKGTDLIGFSLRMNELSEEYELSQDGYILKSETEKYRFFKFSEDEIMLMFTSDNNGELTRMDIVADENAIKNAGVEEFIINSITAFINDSGISNELLTTVPYSSFTEKTLKSKSAKCRNAALMLDVTDINTVISVYIER